MKKILAVFLTILLLLGTLSSCDKILEIGKDAENEFKEKLDDIINNNGEADDEANFDDKDNVGTQKQEANIQEAKTLLEAMMREYNGKITTNDYDVVGRITVGSTEFEVEWTTDNSNIKIRKSPWGTAWSIDIPNVNSNESDYKLIATIKSADGKTVITIFTPKLGIINNSNLETAFYEGIAYKMYAMQINLGYDIYALNTTQKGENKFINTTMDPKEAAVYYFEAVNGGYKIYTYINGIKNYLHATATPKGEGQNGFTKTIGFAENTSCVFTYDPTLMLFKVKLNDVEFGVGTYGIYDTFSLSETKYFKSDNINVKEGQFPINFMLKENADNLPPSIPILPVDPPANSTLTIAQAIELGNTKFKDVYTKAKYYVEGTIKEIQNDQNGNLVITDGTNDLLIYGTHSADGMIRFGNLKTKPVIGDKIKVYGIIGKYNDAQMRNGWIVEGLPEGAVPSTPSTPSDKTEIVTTPVAGTAYKFGLVQGNVNNKLLFINGEMKNTHYFATTENVADAIDVYVEAVTGGYNLYYMNGTTKTYINIKAGGQYVNVKYETSDPTVYTFDETLKTFVVDVTCENESKTGTYCFGTYNTYETVSPVLTSNELFPCQLYTVIEN